MNFGAPLEESLARVAELLRDAAEPWWIIGSTAVALHGGDPGEIRDVDLVVGHADANRYFSRLQLPNAATADDALFRSDLFARWSGPPVPVELMAGLKVNGPGGWRPLEIHSREEVRSGLYAPSREELRAILTLFGRDKDLRRAAALD